jgi:dTDP-4-dehydrorhamnose 3,5-epimerase
MKVIQTDIPGVLAVEPQVFGDDRGFFFESFNQQKWQQGTGLERSFVQDNHSRSIRGVLRGVHYQIEQPQGKLVRVVVGEIFDVAVDLRKTSPTFGKWVGQHLSAENFKQLWIPEGFGHAFVVLSENAEVLYRTTDFWALEHERCITWNDPDLNISWPIDFSPTLSEKDGKGLFLKDADIYE